jgi:hydrogenase maturation protease
MSRSGVLVIGYGNTIRSDDGFGRRAAERLSALAPEGVRVIASHQLELEMAELLRDCAAVVFVDAARSAPAGALRCRRVQADADGSVMTHHLTPEALLALAAQLWNAQPPAWALTIAGARFTLGETLSPAVEVRLPYVVALLATVGR